MIADPFLQKSHTELSELLFRAYQYIDQQYDEKLRLLSLLASFAVQQGCCCGLHKLAEDECESENWQYFLVLDTPGGQFSFPIPNTVLAYFKRLPMYQGIWFGFPKQTDQLRRLLSPACVFSPTDQLTERIPSSW